MSDGPEAWAAEIRDYLVGRLAKGANAHRIRHSRSHGSITDAIRRWWVLEGKRYPALGGSLAAQFCRVRVMVERLAASFNPRLRLSERPDGEVDWALTLSRGGGHQGSDYVVRSSAFGLDGAERAALVGWFGWIQSEYARHAKALGVHAECFDEPQALVDDPALRQRLRKWALVTRRSRWPLLRGVVAESIRPYLEDDEVDRIPLPPDPDKLFELLCLVRIARHFVPRPHAIRWIDKDGSSNTARFDDLTCTYQEHLERRRVLQTPDYAGSLAEAVDAFKVRIPAYVDVAVDFAAPIGGFAGVLVEAKSGSQPYHAAVAQLRTYRAARPRPRGGRYLVWGVVKEPCNSASTAEAVKHMLDVSGDDEDVWVFSTAGDIPLVLDTVFGAALAPHESTWVNSSLTTFMPSASLSARSD